ncbi:YheC/YheD family protein [Evansella sp. LMS18]|uniref:YheC/YheD family protein n=1 Tax=Evansella sp. LMS18 TaxID=2924033 RepID=UPI0020D08A93|nr:YheC/YheD family protein [Evansella sp. LMS18]UTR11799.1 YheC/YheD family protein [Evansella sp. LMS18]
MYIGYMRKRSKPKKFAKLVAKAAKYHGIDLFHFGPEDVDIENRIINGKVLIDDEWESRQLPPPAFIDYSTFCNKYKEVVEFLKENSILSNKRLGSKYNIYKKIQEDGEFAHLIIPTIVTEDPSEVYDFLHKHKEIILKPKNGQRGEGIYKLSLKDGHYFLAVNKEEKTLSKQEADDFLNNEIKVKHYLYQKCIHSKSKSAEPFDVRIRLEKNGKGEWEVAIYLVRIGTGNKVVSNITQGGSASQLDPFLQANYGDDWKKIKRHIKEIARTFPYKLEKIFNTKLQALGVDVGIDSDHRVYFFEANTAPGLDFGMGEVAVLKAEYYNYVAKEVLGHKQGDKSGKPVITQVKQVLKDVSP